MSHAACGGAQRKHFSAGVCASAVFHPGTLFFFLRKFLFNLWDIEMRRRSWVVKVLRASWVNPLALLHPKVADALGWISSRETENLSEVH